MKSILYIGNNENFKSDYGFNSDFIDKIEQKNNGLLAYDFLHNTTYLPHIVFCENTTSGIEASQLFKLLRSNKKFDHIVFILLNGKLTKKEAINFIKNGVDEVIEKPFKLKTLSTRLKFLMSYRNLSKKERRSSKIKPAYKLGVVKRAFDIIVAIVALILISPVLLLTIIAIKIESKGPLFYASKRVGTGYQIFDFYKFRSMHINADEKLKDIKNLNQYANNEPQKIDKECPDCSLTQLCSPILFLDGKEICENHFLRLKKAEDEGTFIKISEDPRVTRVGKFIRNTSIDELPQLINVLKGDMSIVGNRPLPLYEAELLTSDNWAERFMAPAGITGLWQVEKRGSGEMSEEERKLLDNKYAKQHSFFYDIKLILRTIPALLQSENV